MHILYVTTVSNTLGFLVPHISMLVHSRHTVDVACNDGDLPVPNAIPAMGCNVWKVPLNRSPRHLGNICAIGHLRRLIQREKYEVVHVHTPVAAACVRIACLGLSAVNVIYTAHGFHFYKGAPLWNWLLYYPIERLLSRYADALIVINDEDFIFAKRNFTATQVYQVPGMGVDLSRFSQASPPRECMRQRLNIPATAVVMVSVGELNHNKNHATIIRSLALLGTEGSNIHYVVCGRGPLRDYLQQLADTLGLSQRVHLVGFRKDIPDILRIADIFAMPSLREGLGLAAIEAMSMGLPALVADTRGPRDLVRAGLGGYILDPMDASGWAAAILRLAGDPAAREQQGKYNQTQVAVYGLGNAVQAMAQVYTSLGIPCASKRSLQ